MRELSFKFLFVLLSLISRCVSASVAFSDFSFIKFMALCPPGRWFGFAFLSSCVNSKMLFTVVVTLELYFYPFYWRVGRVSSSGWSPSLRNYWWSSFGSLYWRGVLLMRQEQRHRTSDSQTPCMKHQVFIILNQIVNECDIWIRSHTNINLSIYKAK